MGCSPHIQIEAIVGFLLLKGGSPLRDKAFRRAALNSARQSEAKTNRVVTTIWVRLLNLKTVSKGKTATLIKEIANTQRLVEESVQSINRFAHEPDIYQPA
jgi:hypothetical protein